jgi:methionyl-tRNA formyltransferase
MKIIFMGTSAFGYPAYEAILSSKNEIIATYTKQPSVSGRGNLMRISPIHDLALKNNINVITTKTLKDKDVIKQFKLFNADLCIVVSYGLILPKEILEGTKYGCFNIHPSKLPSWRGASPIQRILINNEKESSVCVIKMNEGLDSGDIVAEENFIIDNEDDYISLHDKTSRIGGKLILELIKKLEKNLVLYRKQDHDLATYAKKIDKSECLINWNNYGERIIAQIKALNGNLGAHFFYDNEKIKILKAHFIPLNKSNTNYGIIFDNKFSICCADGIIIPEIIQREGKKIIKIQDFILGFKFEIGKNLNLVTKK